MANPPDYYEVLGVARDASEDDIKRAYRKKAMENHPDRNQGDEAAAARFKTAAEAYAVLSDDEKRGAYDRFGHAGVNGQFGPGGQGFSNFDDIFSAFGDLFGGGGGGGGIFEQFFGGGRRGGRRGASLRVDLELTLEEVAVGARKTIEITRPTRCENCSGSGAKPGTQPMACTTCRGAGQVMRSHGFLAIRQTCPTCEGAGNIIESPCPKCRGRGMQAKKEPITISIPPGIEEGHVERIAGQGEPGPHGAPPGDLVVVIRIQPHQVFVRHGDDLVAQATIRFRQAVLGDSVDVPTIVGETVVLKIPAGTQPGAALRVRGHGLPRGDGYGRGNLVVRVQIEVPKQVSGEQREALERFDAFEEEKSKKGRKKSIFEKVKDIFQ
ncbi:MAG: molecular chaperone DnaJ [Planctomycetota bacterium]